MRRFRALVLALSVRFVYAGSGEKISNNNENKRLVSVLSLFNTLLGSTHLSPSSSSARPSQPALQKVLAIVGGLILFSSPLDRDWHISWRVPSWSYLCSSVHWVHHPLAMSVSNVWSASAALRHPRWSSLLHTLPEVTTPPFASIWWMSRAISASRLVGLISWLLVRAEERPWCAGAEKRGCARRVRSSKARILMVEVVMYPLRWDAWQQTGNTWKQGIPGKQHEGTIFVLMWLGVYVSQGTIFVLKLPTHVTG